MSHRKMEIGNLNKFLSLQFDYCKGKNMGHLQGYQLSNPKKMTIYLLKVRKMMENLPKDKFGIGPNEKIVWIQKIDTAIEWCRKKNLDNFKKI